MTEGIERKAYEKYRNKKSHDCSTTCTVHSERTILDHDILFRGDASEYASTRFVGEEELFCSALYMKPWPMLSSDHSVPGCHDILDHDEVAFPVLALCHDDD
jgi:hypothetical protein